MIAQRPSLVPGIRIRQGSAKVSVPGKLMPGQSLCFCRQAFPDFTFDRIHIHRQPPDPPRLIITGDGDAGQDDTFAWYASDDEGAGRAAPGEDGGATRATATAARATATRIFS